ncbi:YXWGXW repeat-containing protein [Candidatus Nanoperiomorbus periodonticus]
MSELNLRSGYIYRPGYWDQHWTVP